MGFDFLQDLDTFNNPWTFIFESDNDLGQLLSILLDGRTSLVLFDRTDPSFGTDGSFRGTDFDSSLPDTTLIDVTYLNPTGIGGADPVGDIFQQVFIDFGLTGPRSGDFTFLQDTDNDSRFVVKIPEPTTLMLLGLGMLALMRVPRRR